MDKAGKRFAFDYHPQGELAPRDVVSRAIYTHLQKTGDETVYLDLRPIPEAKIRYRFPNIIRVCQKWGVDLFHEPIPVAPAAHYWMGGIAVDTINQTTIPGLYAVGETASTGVHGANRLASNSLLECVVYAAQLSKLELPDLNFQSTPVTATTITEDWQQEMELVTNVRNQLPHLVWQSAGICRTATTMSEAIAKITAWRSQFLDLKMAKYALYLTPGDPKGTRMRNRCTLALPTAESQLKLYAETLNLLDIAYLMLKSALFRTESRGGHYRLDYPTTDADWAVHTIVTDEQWERSSLS